MSEQRGIRHSRDFLELLLLVFIVLKLTGYIRWSWWGVLAPLWIPAVAVVAFVTIVFIAGCVVDHMQGWRS